MGTLATMEYRWLLPAALIADPDDGRPPGRSTRDWAVDTLCFVAAWGFAIWVTADLLSDSPTVVPEFHGSSPPWLVWLDFAGATVASVSLWWRRRWPVQVALLSLPIGAYSVGAAISGMIVLFTVAVHCRFVVTALFGALSVAINFIFVAVRPESGTGYLEAVAWSSLIMVVLILWGMVVRSRRQLVVSLRDRAERAENEQQLRIAQARSLERTRIAREMHDVLAHRISLLSLHAGALEIRPDAAPAEVATAAGVIRASAHQALQDLREVIGVLREAEPVAAGTPERPQPTLAQLSELADESRAAGARVTLDLAVESTQVPVVTGRTAYRIVQEGLTNARKHAPGAVVNVGIGGAPGSGLTIDIRNPFPIGGPPAVIPGAGTGLVGLAERATLAGGRLTHGRTGDNDFVLTAWLPWPA